GWIPDQQRSSAAAVALRGDQRRRAEISSRRRRHADDIDPTGAVEREQARAFLFRADDVVVGQLAAVRARDRHVYVAKRLPGMLRDGRVGPTRGKRADEPDEIRIAQHVDDETVIGRIERELGIELLILDELRSRPGDSLHDEIETLGRGFDAVIVDGDTQVLAAARPPSDEAQRSISGRHVDAARSRAVREPHDDRALAAVQKEVLHGVRDEAVRRMAAEDTAVVVEARDRHGPIDGAALRSSEERDDGHRSRAAAVSGRGSSTVLTMTRAAARYSAGDRDATPIGNGMPRCSSTTRSIAAASSSTPARPARTSAAAMTRDASSMRSRSSSSSGRWTSR